MILADSRNRFQMAAHGLRPAESSAPFFGCDRVCSRCGLPRCPSGFDTFRAGDRHPDTKPADYVFLAWADNRVGSIYSAASPKFFGFQPLPRFTDHRCWEPFTIPTASPVIQLTCFEIIAPSACWPPATFSVRGHQHYIDSWVFPRSQAADGPLRPPGKTTTCFEFFRPTSRR